MAQDPPHYTHLGAYSDWPAAAAARLDGARSGTRDVAPNPAELRARIGALLDVPAAPEPPADVRVESRWTAGGLAGEELSWSVGYGPRTRAVLLRPAQASGPLPGVVALHCHSGFTYHGYAKIADGPQAPDTPTRELRAAIYGGVAIANELARRGFAVLAHDTFGWGSRRFGYEQMPADIRRLAELEVAGGEPATDPHDAAVRRYNAASGPHEHLVAKYCTVLGTSFPAVVAAEDRIAAGYLAHRPDVAGPIGCVGLSGGGCRAALLTATSDDVAAAVVVGMMCTYAGLLDHNIASHTWMLFPPGLARFADWPDLAACHAPTPLLVQYDLDDHLFTVPGMRAADERIRQTYAAAGAPDRYLGRFYPGPHKFDAAMQAEASDFLATHLAR